MATKRWRRRSARSDAACDVSVVITPGHIAYMNPPVPEVQPVLEYVQYRFVPDDPTRLRRSAEAVRLWDLDDWLVFPAGLWPRVRGILRGLGHKLSVDDRRTPGPRLAIDADVVDRCHGAQRHLLTALEGEPLGQVEVGSPEGDVETCALIARAYPQARFAIGVATRRAALRLRRDVARVLHEPVGLALPRVRWRDERVMVGTYQCVPRYRECGWDILLLPDGGTTSGTWAADLVARSGARRVYAVVCPGRHPDRLEQLRLETMAGPVIHRVQFARARVRVVMLPVTTCPSAGTTALERQRARYWHNADRNQAIASVADAFVCQDWPWLRQEAGLTPNDLAEFMDLNVCRVAVLVECPEHGRQLLPLLPEWTMRDYIPPPEDGSQTGGRGKGRAGRRSSRQPTRQRTESGRMS